MNNDISPVSKEGWNYIGYSIAFFILFVLLHLNILSFIAVAFIAFFVFVYRNPERELSSFEENMVYSPIDGTIVYVENLVNSDYAYRIEIDSNCTNIGLLRSPMDAKIVNSTMINGTKLPLSSDLAQKLNESTIITFENRALDKVMVQHLSKVSFTDLKLTLEKNQLINVAVRYGFMINGTTSIYLPKNFHLELRAGSKVIASQTLLGSFK